MCSMNRTSLFIPWFHQQIYDPPQFYCTTEEPWPTATSLFIPSSKLIIQPHLNRGRCSNVKEPSIKPPLITAQWLLIHLTTSDLQANLLSPGYPEVHRKNARDREYPRTLGISLTYWLGETIGSFSKKMRKKIILYFPILSPEFSSM